MHKRIVITGLGIVSAGGIGKAAFLRSLQEGVSGIRPVTLFTTDGLRCKKAGEVVDFQPETILGPKGLRTLDRSTKLSLAAAKLALDDAGMVYPFGEEETDRWGVSLGTTLGSVWSISEFDKEAIRGGPRAVNPALFPNTVINSPASHLSIKFNIQGFNTTMSTGFCSSIDAVRYALNMLELYDYHAVLAGGVEDLCEQTYKGFYKIGHLAGSAAGKEEISCPFDRRRNGMVLGEGAAFMVLEEREHAKKRGAMIYAEVLGYGSAFESSSRPVHDRRGRAAMRAMRACLDDARLATDDIDYIAAGANSTPDCDLMETQAVKGLFGDRARSVALSAVKSLIGDAFSASGAMSLASTVLAIAEGFLPPTVNYQEPDRRCDLDYVPNAARRQRTRHALVNAFDPTGLHTVLAVGAHG